MKTVITPASLVGHADALEAACESLEELGVMLHTAGRLRLQVKLLRNIATAGAFPKDASGLLRTINAIRDAAEFGLIGAVLGSDPEGTITKELQKAVAGSLEQDEDKREPYQFQAQYFFGAILTASDADVGVAPGGGPDFFVPNGGMHHGIEVKAPSGLKGLGKAVSKAADQLRVRGRGMLVLDVSKLVAEVIPLVDPTGTQSSLKASVEAAFHPLRDQVRDLVTGGHAHAARRGYEGIMASACVARVAQWHGSESSLRPALSAAFSWRRYYSTRHNLWWHRGTWMGQVLEEALGHHVPDLSVTYVP